MVKRRVAILLLTALHLSSCMRITIPASYSYYINASEDLLELFEVDVLYYNHRNERINERISSPDWECTLYVPSPVTDAEPQHEGMKVTLSAKEAALKGIFPEKSTFRMYLDYDVTYSPEHQENPFRVSVKSNNSETFSFRIPLGNTDPDDVTIDIAPLKYDKHFAFSYSIDDSYENGWSRIFACINGLWIDDQEFFHFGMSPTAGYRDDPLCITDGCGNDRRFTFGESIQPSLSNKYNEDGIIHDENTSKYHIYITWQELQMMTDMGNAVYWHDVSPVKWSQQDPSEIVEGLSSDYDKTFSKIGYRMKTLAQPNGSQYYVEAAMLSPLVCLVRVTGNNYTDICFDDNPSLYKASVFGGNSNATNEEKLDELYCQSCSDHPLLVSKFCHRPNEDEVEFLRTVARLYGKGGADNIWVASYDELYDYSLLRNNVTISSFVEEDCKVFEVTIPQEVDVVNKELSFVISNGSEVAQRCSDNLCGFSSAVRDDGTVLVNCNFGSRCYDLALKYVSLYEQTRNEYYKNFADYLVSLLRDDLQAELKERIDDVHEPTMEEMPLEGEYSLNQLPDYIRLYDGYSFVIPCK